MKTLSAKLGAGICVAICAFHGALILGAPWGRLTQGGRVSGSLDLTGRLVAAVSIVVLILMAAALLAQVGRGPLRRLSLRVRRALGWFTVAYTVLAVILNLITPSNVERMVWVPISLILLSCVVVTLMAKSAD